MNPSHPSQNSQENRKYVRLESVFPVDFTIVRLQGDLPGIDWQRAQTNNVSEEGMCLETSQLTESTIKFLSQQNIMLELRMFIPPTQPAIKAVGEVVWYQKENDKFIIGLKFRSIIRSELDRILKHARWFKGVSTIAINISFIVFLGLLIFAMYTYFKGHH